LNTYRQTDTMFFMNTIGQRAAHARKLRKLSQKAVAEKVGISQPTLSELERGESDGTKFIVELAEALSVRVGWLKNGEGNLDADPVLDNNVTPGPYVGGEVPLISWVQAGNWQEAVDNYQPGYAEETVTATVQVKRHTFALRVKGDSMEPDFRQDDILIVEPEMEPEPGDLVVVKNGDNEATFKKLVQDGGDWYLKPLNPAYPTKLLHEGMRIVGVVRQRVSKFR